MDTPFLQIAINADPILGTHGHVSCGFNEGKSVSDFRPVLQQRLTDVE